MYALVNAGGKGSRMGRCGVEKPMQVIGDEPCIGRVIDALQDASRIDGVFVSVSPNTPKTREYVISRGVEVVDTSGESFMDDLHRSFEAMEGRYVLTTPSDIPLLSASVIDRACDAFRPDMQSMIVLVSAETVRGMGVTPSYIRDIDGEQWVISGLSIMDREATLRGEYLNEAVLRTDWKELAVNVNTQGELALARGLFV